MLQKLGFKDYGTLTVLINGDEEISSPGSRSTITHVASDQDASSRSRVAATMAAYALPPAASARRISPCRASPRMPAPGPEGGVNALYELSHQLLQLKDLSQNDRGLKLNWTVSQAGTNRNVIPAEATAQADARALKVSDFDQLQATLQERIKNQLLPEAKVQLKFEVRRPPLEATDASRKLSAHARRSTTRSACR